jgi:hypothetical protein
MLSTISILQLWATNLLSGIIGALIGGVLSFFGGVRGARIAAQTAIDLQEREFASRDQAAKLADQGLIRSTVQSISDEVEALWKHYNREIGPHFASLQPGQTAKVFHANQSYFVIFDAAGSLVGRIPSQTLRSKIIDFYIGAKAFVDSLQYYERLCYYYDTIVRTDRANEIWQSMIAYSAQLKVMIGEFSRLYDVLKPELNGYLNATPADQTVYPNSIPKA